MPSLRNMIGETGVIEIPVSNDEPLVVTYKRGKRTPRSMIRVLKAQVKLSAIKEGEAPDPEVFEILVEMLASALISWNLTDDDGLPIPCTGEGMSDVDMEILTAISNEIGRQQTVDPLSGGGSNNGLSAVASSEPLQITTA